MNQLAIHMYESGRLSLPAQFRKELGVEKDVDFVATCEDGVITLRLARNVREAARLRLASRLKSKKSLVDELFAMRCEEVAKEDAEFAEFIKASKNS
jgi:DNA-binding transcriptional regulator/RsmH inhibitor MraZ